LFIGATTEPWNLDPNLVSLFPKRKYVNLPFEKDRK